jgi:hypothetical protein
MAIGMANVEYLSEKGLLTRHSKILDIGSQNLLSATAESIRLFVQKYGHIDDEATFVSTAAKIAYFSTIRPGERTSYISELIELTDIFYTSYDVCPALKTEIMDLNREFLPKRYRGYFDLVFNFGTTEHIFNQLNSFEVMHEALEVGGICFHQVPSLGWGNHGYFCYHEVFFYDLTKANEYEIVDMWYCPVGVSKIGVQALDFRDALTPLIPGSASSLEEAANYNLNVIVRKIKDAPFHVGLELATAHSSLSDQVKVNYRIDPLIS